jgi:hypothetical protein
MLLRCAGMAMTGMMFTAGLAAGAALGGGAVVAALVGRRLWQEKQGWRSGSDAADADSLPPLPPEPGGPLPDPLA